MTATVHDTDIAARIVDTAVALAEEAGWEAVRLHDVAARLHIGFDVIARHFAEKDALIDAWFDRADQAVLKLAGSSALDDMSVRQRLSALIMAWLAALEAHRAVTRQMILAKLEPGHLHIQLPALTRISRTVQWIREGAGLRDRGIRRAGLESAVTGLYLAAFASWMTENVPGSPRTRRLLDAKLLCAESLMNGLDRLTGGMTPTGRQPRATRPGASVP